MERETRHYKVQSGRQRKEIKGDKVVTGSWELRVRCEFINDRVLNKFLSSSHSTHIRRLYGFQSVGHLKTIGVFDRKLGKAATVRWFLSGCLIATSALSLQ